MKKKGLMGALCSIFLTVSFLNAAEANKSAKPEANSTKKTVSSSKKSSIEEAKKLLEEMNLKKVYEAAVNSSTQRLVRGNSKFKKVEGKIKAFYNKYIGWDSMKDDLAKLYAKYYTADELKDIIAFYKTKTGKKVLATMGKLTYEGQMLTRNKLVPHIKELNNILESAMKADNKQASKKENNKTKK